MNAESMSARSALVTGASRRIGAQISRRLHGAGARVAIHCRHSIDAAAALAAELNAARADSARVFAADLLIPDVAGKLVHDVAEWAHGLHFLVNNASSFYPTPVGTITEADWDDLMGSNLKAPLFLTQAAQPHLSRASGAVLNIIDIHAQRPLRDHSVYGAAKAGLAMLTRALAKDLAPEVRVNGIAPGAILWPETGASEAAQQNILRQIPLGRTGSPADIADCALYLLRDASYVTGQVIAVDGGRSIGW